MYEHSLWLLCIHHSSFICATMCRNPIKLVLLHSLVSVNFFVASIDAQYGQPVLCWRCDAIPATLELDYDYDHSESLVKLQQSASRDE